MPTCARDVNTLKLRGVLLPDWHAAQLQHSVLGVCRTNQLPTRNQYVWLLFYFDEGLVLFVVYGMPVVGGWRG